MNLKQVLWLLCWGALVAGVCSSAPETGACNDKGEISVCISIPHPSSFICGSPGAEQMSSQIGISPQTPTLAGITKLWLTLTLALMPSYWASTRSQYLITETVAGASVELCLSCKMAWWALPVCYTGKQVRWSHFQLCYFGFVLSRAGSAHAADSSQEGQSPGAPSRAEALVLSLCIHISYEASSVSWCELSPRSSFILPKRVVFWFKKIWKYRWKQDFLAANTQNPNKLPV